MAAFFWYHLDMIRMIVSDCDGTLLNNRSEIDDETILAITRFQEAGGLFMRATGRNRWDADYVTERVRNCVLNCDNGAMLFDSDGKELMAHEIGRDKIRAMNDLSKYYDFMVIYHGINGSYITCDLEKLKERAIRQIRMVYTPAMAEDIFDWVFNNIHYRYGVDISKIVDENIIKMEPVFIPDGEYELICDECQRIFKDMNVYIGTFLNNIEINSKESDKGKTALEYCRLKGIKEDEVAAIGDSVNDISMFRLFENSYCVQNGQSEAKRTAKYIIDSNDDLGVAKLINKICDENVYNR